MRSASPIQVYIFKIFFDASGLHKMTSCRKMSTCTWPCSELTDVKQLWCGNLNFCESDLSIRPSGFQQSYTLWRSISALESSERFWFCFFKMLWGFFLVTETAWMLSVFINSWTYLLHLFLDCTLWPRAGGPEASLWAYLHRTWEKIPLWVASLLI